jgi:hypothetical protein
VKGYQWWPAKVLEYLDAPLKSAPNARYRVAFLGPYPSQGLVTKNFIKGFLACREETVATLKLNQKVSGGTVSHNM